MRRSLSLSHIVCECVIKNGRVYDLDYSKYKTVVNLPTECRRNSVDNLVRVTRELRLDIASGEFYVLMDDGRYNGRESVALAPISRDEAMKIAEDYLGYDDYVKFFGDPEGGDAGLARERDKALEEKKSAEDMKEFWYKEYSEANRKVDELKERIAELEAK